MKARKRFEPEVLERVRREKIFGIRAGRQSTHRVIGV